MYWSPSEQRERLSIIGRIESYTGKRNASPPSRSIVLNVEDADDLTVDLADIYGSTLLVRHLLRSLGFDERRLFTYRLEHKLVQAHILAHYCPDSVPVTVGMAGELKRLTLEQAERKANEAYDDGFILKPALGSRSGDISSPLVNRDSIRSIISGMESVDGLSDETFIFQKHVSIVAEYRVHSIESSVIPELTYARYLPQTTCAEEARRPSEFVQDVINNLPDGVVADSLYGWDVAIDQSGATKIIEVNAAGFHPICRPGFQCSGFFDQPAWSIASLARLLAAVARRYGVAVQVVAASALRDQFATTYRLVDIYHSFHQTAAFLASCFSRGSEYQVYAEKARNDLSREENALIWAAAELSAIRSLMKGDVLAKIDESDYVPASRTQGEPSTTSPYHGPVEVLTGSTIEQQVISVWQEVLGILDVQGDDTFTSLGGDSILAIRLINQLRIRFSIEVSFAWLLTADASIRNLASIIEAGTQ